MAKYKRQFTKEEIDKFNKIEKDKIRYSAMEVYSHLLKRALEEGTSRLALSLKTFLKRFNRYGNTLSGETLNSRMKLLSKIGLIVIEKIKNTNVYSLVSFFSATKKLDEKLDEKSEPQSIDTTDLDSTSEKHKAESISLLELESTTKVEKIDYETFIKNSEKATAEEITIKAHQMFRDMKVKSYKVKSKVMENLMRYAGKITVKGLEKYIEIAIKQKQIYDKECYRRNIIGYKKPLRFTDYEGQRKYNYEDLEKKLLGW